MVTGILPLGDVEPEHGRSGRKAGASSTYLAAMDAGLSPKQADRVRFLIDMLRDYIRLSKGELDTNNVS